MDKCTAFVLLFHKYLKGRTRRTSWHSWRRRILLFPKQVSAALFLLRGLYWLLTGCTAPGSLERRSSTTIQCLSRPSLKHSWRSWKRWIQMIHQIPSISRLSGPSTYRATLRCCSIRLRLDNPLFGLSQRIRDCCSVAGEQPRVPPVDFRTNVFFLAFGIVWLLLLASDRPIVRIVARA